MLQTSTASLAYASSIHPVFQESERKRELERTLERDCDELAFYEDMMTKTGRLTTKTGIMLDSVDARLDKLRESIIPIHDSTQKLSKIHDNIDKSLNLVNMTLSYFDKASAENAILIKGVQEDHFQDYLESVERILVALRYLNETNYKAADRGVSELKGILKIAVSNLNETLKKWLKATCSAASLPTDTEVEESYWIPDHVISSLSAVAMKLSSALDLLQECVLKNYDAHANVGGTLVGTKVTGVKRVDEGKHLIQCFTPMANSCVHTTTATVTVPLSPSSSAAGAATTGYQKGTGRILLFTRSFFKLLKTEKQVVSKLFPKATALTTYQSTISPLVTLYIDTCEQLLAKTKRTAIAEESNTIGVTAVTGIINAAVSSANSNLNVPGHASNAASPTTLGVSAAKLVDSSFLIMDLIECLSQVSKEYEGIIVYAGTKGLEINEMLSRMKAACGYFFKDFHDEFKMDSPKHSSLPVDGTVHELTSKTVTTLRKLIDYQVIIDHILSEGWGVQASFPVSNFTALVSEAIEQLVINLENRSKLYVSKFKTPVLTSIFLMNNYQYLYKAFVKDKRLASLLGGQNVADVASATSTAPSSRALEERFTKLVTKQKEAYLNSWKPLYDHLLDSTYIQGGVMMKTLNKQQRDVVKDKFKGFNSDFEEMLRVQKSYAIPDPELRHQVLNDIKSVLLVLYSRFWERYQTTEFSKNVDKYMKYDIESLSELLHEFFSSSS